MEKTIEKWDVLKNPQVRLSEVWIIHLYILQNSKTCKYVILPHNLAQEHPCIHRDCQAAEEAPQEDA